MKKLRLTLTILILFSFGLTFSQEKMKITGAVFDSSGTNPLPESIVMAVRLKDSLMLGFTRTDQNGNFDLKNIPVDTFNLIVSHFKFEEKSFFVFGSFDNKEINIPKINLGVKTKTTELAEVVIYTNKNPIYFRGDTMVYVADSFKVGANSVVEDLLKKLPGIQVDKEGNIKSQGKEISQVLVDGDEFFGSDPTTATKNLNASTIDKVEVFEKKNESSTEGDETVQVLNLKLKEDAKKGYFGKVSGASDFTKFYESELMINKFNGSQKISVFAISGNTMKSSMDWNDINQYGLDNEMNGMMNEDGEYMWFNSGGNDQSGIPQTFKSGIYYKDKIGKNKKTDLGINYTYMNYQLHGISDSKTQYFLQDTTYFSEDFTDTKKKNESHKININIESKLDSLTTLIIKPKFDLSLGTESSINTSRYINQDTLITRTNDILSSNNSTGNELKNEFKLIRKFKKDRRKINFEYYGDLVENKTNGKLYFDNIYMNSFSDNDTTDQSKINRNSKVNHLGTVLYSEPLTKKIKLDFQYDYEYGINSQIKESRDFFNGDYSILNQSLSNNFENVKTQNRFSTMFVYESKKHILKFGGKVRNIQLRNINLVSKDVVNQDLTNFLPRLTYSYRPKQNMRMQVRYSTNANQPSINSLQPIFDNSNPNRIPIGNPTLKPSFDHNSNGSYNSWNSVDGRYIWAGFNANLTNNAFGDSTYYDEYNRQYSKTVNTNGNYFANFYFGSSFSVLGMFELGPNLNGSQNQRINYINGQKNTTVTKSINPSLNLSLELDSVYFTVDYSYEYNSPYSSISSVSNKPYNTQVISSYLSWTLPFWHLKIDSDVNYTINSKRADGYNIKYLIWNMTLSKSMLKKENLIVSIQGNDILKQNILAQRNVSSNMITDNKTQIVTRYFLFKLTYKFDSNKTTEENEE